MDSDKEMVKNRTVVVSTMRLPFELDVPIEAEVDDEGETTVQASLSSPSLVGTIS